MSSNENAKESPKKIGKARGCAFILIGLVIVIIILAIIGSMIEDDGEGRQMKAQQEPVQQEEPKEQQEAQEQAPPPEVQKEPEPDNIKYKTVKMPDGKVWFAENLNEAIGKSKCYDNKEENCKKCGRLYDWKTAKKACPAGWHLPSNEEWDALSNAIGGDELAGGFLKSKNGWKMNNGTDKYGFSALPCDKKPYASRLDSSNYGASAYFRISTDTDDGSCRGLSMGIVVNGAKQFHTVICGQLASVRCVKD